MRLPNGPLPWTNSPAQLHREPGVVTTPAPRFTLHITPHPTLHTQRSTPHTPGSTVHTPSFTHHTPHSRLHTSPSTLHTSHSTFHNSHSTLRSPHSTGSHCKLRIVLNGRTLSMQKRRENDASTAITRGWTNWSHTSQRHGIIDKKTTWKRRGHGHYKAVSQLQPLVPTAGNYRRKNVVKTTWTQPLYKALDQR